jgi:hypothetical protein
MQHVRKGGSQETNMKVLLKSLVIFSSLFSALAMASDLQCVLQKSDDCFVNAASDTMAVSADNQKIVLNSPTFTNIQGAFERTVPETGSAQYAGNEISDMLSECKIYLSSDLSSLTITIDAYDGTSRVPLGSCNYGCIKK